MKVPLAVGTTLPIVTMCLACGQPEPTANPTRASLGSGELEIGAADFGRVSGQDSPPLERVFEYRNTSDATWHAGETWTTCGCIRVLDVTSRVAPGQVLRIRVSLDVQDLLGEREYRVFARVRGLDRVLAARVRVVVDGPLRSEPSTMVFQPVPENEKQLSAKASVYVPLHGGDVPGLTVVQPMDVQIEVREPEQRLDEAKFDVLASGTQAAIAEAPLLRFTVVGGVLDGRDLRVRTHIQVPPRISVSPRMLLLQSQVAEGTLNVSCPEGVDTAELAVELEPPEAGDAALARGGVVHVRLRPGADGHAHVVLRLGSTDVTRVPVLVMGESDEGE